MRACLRRPQRADNLMLGAYLRRDAAAVARDLERCSPCSLSSAERQRQDAVTLSGGEQQMSPSAAHHVEPQAPYDRRIVSLGLAP